MLEHDRKITISAGNSRKSINWQPLTLYISELYEKLRVPARGVETMAQYNTLTKAQQGELKDVGGFVGGGLIGTRRKAGACAGRDVITLDLDNIPPGGTVDILRRVEGLGCGYCVYSTRKHTAAVPRLRVILPLDRTADADEYEPAARKIAELIGLEFADPSTFEPLRLMYWPSCCVDGEYIYTWQDKRLLWLDGVLDMYEDWRDINSWPRQPREKTPAVLATRQADPRAKPGVIGAFCRVYDIDAAVAAFLPEVYTLTDEASDNRYTFNAGSTAGGAIVYDGNFFYSHHATDPCNGQLVNAFDLVRLHKFGELDAEAKAECARNRLPSYNAMCEFAAADSEVKAHILQERAHAAQRDFEGAVDDEKWEIELLDLNPKNNDVLPTIDNAWIILEHDPNLRGKFALNEFTGRGEVLGALPWDKGTDRRTWEDNDNQGLYWYFEKRWQFTGNKKIDSALSLHSSKHRFNDVVDYLGGLTWDGAPRLDKLFINYLGAADNAYVRTVTRKAFVAAVARAMTPGCKYDTLVIISGPQGIGKSTLLDTMSRGWFNDNIRTFEGKEASELLQKVWLVEISELEAFQRTDISRIKQFLSLRVDRFRAAYGRHIQELPRRCVFFGTTNSSEFLQDSTGNRRFLPVDVTGDSIKSIWDDLPGEADQIWAEAVMRWRFGESLHLSAEMTQEAETIQEAHLEHDAWEGVVLDFLERQVPSDWQNWPLDKRLLWYGGAITEGVNLVERDRVCALEIWLELLGGMKKDFNYGTTKRINAIINKIEGWQPISTARVGYCGTQRGFKRVNSDL